MKATLLKKIHNIEIKEISIRQLNKNELLIKVDNGGFCDTDRLIYDGTALANTPVILGHEFSGKIVDNLKCKKDFSVGKKVVVDPIIYCGCCQYCKESNIQFYENKLSLRFSYLNSFLLSKAVNLILHKRLIIKYLISKYIPLVKINDILTYKIDSQIVKYQIIT